MEWNKGESEDQFYQRYLESKKKLKIGWNGIKSQKKWEKCDVFIVNRLFASYLALCDSNVSQLQSLWKPTTAGSNFRSLFENFLNLVYLFHTDEISYKLKIEAFQYCEAKNFLKATDYLYYTKIKIMNSSQKLNEEMFTVIQKSYFKKIEKERIKRLKHLARSKESIVEKEYQQQVKKKTENIYWYTLFSGNENLKKLCEYLGFSDFYQQLYSILSIEIHGISLFLDNNTIPDDDFEKFQQIIKVDYIQQFTDLLAESVEMYSR